MEQTKTKTEDFHTPINVEYGKLKKIIAQLKKNNFKDSDLVSFEYIVGSCFPNIYENIKTEIRTAYTKGYIEGLSSKEDASNNDIN